MPSSEIKLVDALQVLDLKRCPVWEFVSGDQGDETMVRPVKRLPVTSLAGKIVGSRVRLASGNRLWALIGNLDTKNVRLNERFATFSFERNGLWFNLARYHDADYDRRGPSALARFLGISVDEVFPILYDVRPYVKRRYEGARRKGLEEPH